jgi:hypothetical protein
MPTDETGQTRCFVVAATRAADFTIDFIWTLLKLAPTTADTELWKVIKELQIAVESLKIQATPPPKRPGNEKTREESERIYRTNNGVLNVNVVTERGTWPGIVRKICSFSAKALLRSS